MDENINFAKIRVWLPVLMYCAFASIINSIITYFPFIPASLTTWISRCIMLAVTICMFQLVPVHDRYQKAGIFRAIMLACNLITAFIAGSMILTLTASIVSIIAVYQEYSTHAEVITEKDSKLSSGPLEPMAPNSDAIRPATIAMPHLPFRALRAILLKSDAYFINCTSQLTEFQILHFPAQWQTEISLRVFGI